MSLFLAYQVSLPCSCTDFWNLLPSLSAKELLALRKQARLEGGGAEQSGGSDKGGEGEKEAHTSIYRGIHPFIEAYKGGEGEKEAHAKTEDEEGVEGASARGRGRVDSAHTRLHTRESLEGKAGARDREMGTERDRARMGERGAKGELLKSARESVAWESQHRSGREAVEGERGRAGDGPGVGEVGGGSRGTGRKALEVSSTLKGGGEGGEGRVDEGAVSQSQGEGARSNARETLKRLKEVRGGRKEGREGERERRSE